jgi:Bacterial SH3 domain
MPGDSVVRRGWLRKSPMNSAILSLCVLGAGLATANILIMPRPTCPSAGTKVTAAYNEVPSTKTQSAITPKNKPPQASKAAATKPASAPSGEALNKAHGKPSEVPTQAKKAAKPAAKPPAPPPTDADATGSVKVTAKPETPDGHNKIENEPEEWAEVSLAAKVHEAPSVSSPTVRYYRLGTRLKVIGRESGWVKIADPTTAKVGWIYEKYLTPTEGPDQKKSAQTESNDANVATPAQPGPYARPYRPRKYGWKRYRYPGPPVGFAIRVYPRW